ncbi:MAG TPA: hypothetical protein VGJ78_24255 [Vicinamibacterales bacterium]
MAIPRPPYGLRWIFSQTSTYDIAIAGFASVAGLSSAWTSWSQDRPVPALLALSGTVGVLVFSVIKQAVSLAAARRKQSTHELEGCLHTLHEVLAPGACRLRLAIHVPVNAILFLEATQRDFFTPQRQQVVVAAVRGIAVFVGKRYTDQRTS